MLGNYSYVCVVLFIKCTVTLTLVLHAQTAILTREYHLQYQHSRIWYGLVVLQDPVGNDWSYVTTT